MIISLINHSSVICDAEVQQVIRAINRQIREDFDPNSDEAAQLRPKWKSKLKAGLGYRRSHPGRA